MSGRRGPNDYSTVAIGIPYTLLLLSIGHNVRLSFAIAKHTAEMVIEGLCRARHIAAISA